MNEWLRIILPVAFQGGFKTDPTQETTLNPKDLFKNPIFWQALANAKKWENWVEKYYEFKKEAEDKDWESAVKLLSELVSK